MKIRYWLLAMSFIFLSCGRVADDVAANYGIIPMPNELAPMQGVYVLQGEKTVAVPSGEAAMKVFHYLEDALKNTSVTLKGISETGKADICLSIDNSLPNESRAFRSVFLVLREHGFLCCAPLHCQVPAGRLCPEKFD